MLSSQTIEQVKGVADIVSIISEYITLKRKGRNHVGFCPFHTEKTPSFTVSPEKGIWHCFGCHVSGNLISFIMKIDNLSFIETITTIAKKTGIQIIEDKNSPAFTPEEQEKKTIKDIIYESREYFKANLSKAPTVNQYLLGRGINESSIKRFHLGYASHSNDLLNYLIKTKNFSPEKIQKSGIFASNEKGLQSRFINRAIFPIIDYQGRTVGFGGRTLEKESKYAKYLNSEETELFNKRNLLYGLNQAKSFIKEQNQVLLMEGYMDVIIAHQYGFQNTVGVMGTALTEPHIQKLKRFTNTFYLILDNDEAGKIATKRSLDLLLKHNSTVFIVDFAEKDPADYLISHGAEKFSHLIKEAKSAIEYKFFDLKQKFGLSSIETKTKILNELIPLLQKEKESIVQTHYIRFLAKELDIASELILAKTKKIATLVKKKKFGQLPAHKNKYLKAQEIILYILATENNLRNDIFTHLKSDDLIDEKAKSIYKRIKETELCSQSLLETIEKEDEKSFLTKIIVKGEENNFVINQETVYKDYIDVLKCYQKNQKIESIKNQIKELSKGSDNENKIKILCTDLLAIKKEMMILTPATQKD